MKIKLFLSTLLFIGAIGLAVINVSAAKANTQDQVYTFTFKSLGDAENDWTYAERKYTESYMYLKNNSKQSFNVKPQVDSKTGEGTKWVTANERGFVKIAANKKYGIAQTAVEDYFSGVLVRFYAHMDVPGLNQKITAQVYWSPDYVKESSVIYYSNK